MTIFCRDEVVGHTYVKHDIRVQYAVVSIAVLWASPTPYQNLLVIRYDRPYMTYFRLDLLVMTAYLTVCLFFIAL